MAQLFANNADSTLASGISAGALSLSVASGDGAKFPSPSGGDYFLLTLYKVSGINEFSWEIVKVTARSTDTLTIVRAQEGTAATAFDADDRVSLRWTAGAASNTLQAVANLSDLDDAATARTNLGLGTAAEADSTDFASAAQGTLADGALQAADDLSDLASASTARTNLGLGTAAVLAATAVLQAANNLSDLASASTARSNLGLGTAATTAASAYATAAQGTKADAALPLAGGTMTGLMTLDGTTGDIATASGSASTFNVIGDAGAGNAAFIGFNRAGAFAAYLGLDTNSKWAVGGWSYGAAKYLLFHEGHFTGAVHSDVFGITIPGTGSLGTNAAISFINSAGNTNQKKWKIKQEKSGADDYLEIVPEDDAGGFSSGVKFYSSGGVLGDIIFGGSSRIVMSSASDDGVSDIMGNNIAGTTVSANTIAAVGSVTAPAMDFSAVINDGSSSTSKTIDFTTGQYHKVSMTGNCTFTFTAPYGPCVVQLELTQSTGSHTMTLPGTVKWPGNYSASDKLLSTAASARDLLILRWNGTDYVANLIKGIA